MEAKEIPNSTKKEKKEVKPDVSTKDIYWEFVKAAPCSQPSDVAAFRMKEGMIVIFTDALGRSVTNNSFYLTDSVFNRLKELSEKKE